MGRIAEPDSGRLLLTNEALTPMTLTVRARGLHSSSVIEKEGGSVVDTRPGTYA